MVRRVSSSQLVASTMPRASYDNTNKWYEHLVNLSVKDNPKVVRRLKLIGDPYCFTEYVDKQYVPNPTNDPSLRGKTVRVPFPDADVNRSFNRIGNDDDPANCPWKKLGYISTVQYAQNCFERQEDGTWEVKILKKGKSIFKAIAMEQMSRLTNDELDDDDPKHFGTRVSPCVRITATATGLDGPKSVEYSVSFDPKSTTITDEMIEQLRKCGEPSAEDLKKERDNYIQAAKEDSSMPEWEDFFAYGWQLNKIFKHTPVKTEANTAFANKKVEEDISPDLEDMDFTPKTKTISKSVVELDDEDDFVATPVKSVKKSTPKPVVVEEEDDEDGDLGWMND